MVDTDPTIPSRGILKPRAGEKEVVIVPGLNHVLWAACKDNETSDETVLDGIRQGIFTYAFFKVLRRAGMGVTRRQLDSLVTHYVKSLGFSQHPQVEGTAASMAEKVFT